MIWERISRAGTSSGVARESPETNADAIAAIAAETHQPLSVVKGIYDGELARLKAKARILDYVVLFAARRTKTILSQQTPVSRPG
jgi:hypothetical protein